MASQAKDAPTNITKSLLRKYLHSPDSNPTKHKPTTKPLPIKNCILKPRKILGQRPNNKEFIMDTGTNSKNEKVKDKKVKDWRLNPKLNFTAEEYDGFHADMIGLQMMLDNEVESARQYELQEEREKRGIFEGEEECEESKEKEEIEEREKMEADKHIEDPVEFAKWLEDAEVELKESEVRGKRAARSS